MTFTLPDHWVWDFWIVTDGQTHHLYYLHAPRSLGDESLRHRNARIGHATSPDLRAWTDHGVVLEPGTAGRPDETATWTGSVVAAPEGGWRLFYTGSRFLDPLRHVNVQTVLAADSVDLHGFAKRNDIVLSADAHWYETTADGSWHEEAWRDPWVFADPDGDGWHMLVTARAAGDHGRDRGVVGHATSVDQRVWTIRAPLSESGAGFAHVEVPQVVTIDGKNVLMFCCDSAHLAGARSGDEGGIWVVECDDVRGPFRMNEAYRLTGDDYYAGRAVQDARGQWQLMAFANRVAGGDLEGYIHDPIPLLWDRSGRLRAGTVMSE